MTRVVHPPRTRGSAVRGYLSIALALAVLASPAWGMTVAQKKQLAQGYFEKAERMREALNGRPAKDRKKRNYQQVINAYRRVYFTSPTSNKADSSVVAVAELMVEQGRALKSDAILKQAIKQYEFLRKEYPGSKYRVEALYTIAQIYRDDLNDNAQAKATLEDFVKRYAHTSLVDDARAALKELDGPVPKQVATKKTESPKTEKSKAASAAGKEQARESVEVTASGTKFDPRKDAIPAETAASAPKPDSTGENNGPLPLVTGIRHWSTPDYTRIAIDLEEDVKFDSGRIPNPDRIYFDLKETRLSSVLKGKSFDVDDGFLQRIRVAQFMPGQTRVVLEVGDDVGEYSAFLLPNPYRLIIDIQGKKVAKQLARTKKPQPDPDKEAKSEPTQPAKSEATVASKEEVKPEKASEKTVEIAKATPPAPPKAEQPEPKNEVANTEPETPVKKISDHKETPSSEVTAEKKNPESKLAEPSANASKTEIVKATNPQPPVKDEPNVRVRGKKRQPPETLDVHTARPTTDGERSLIRALGLKIGRIVVDAGHGGHDTGTIGPDGLLEKDLVLDVSLRFGKLLSERLGAEVVYTRDDDTFVPLETRTAIANQQQADLFISVHANSSRDKSARGVETYYLNFTSSRDALEVAARENAVSEKSIHELQDLVKKIALKDKIEESREFALDVQQSLYTGLSTKNFTMRDRGVKKAPFIVLIGANMPSILAEISFISNPTDERKLKTPEYRQKIAESLYKGVARYVGGLSGVKVAARLPKSDGPAN